MKLKHYVPPEPPPIPDDAPLWVVPEQPSRIEAREALPPKFRAAQDRVTWDDFRALLERGIPARDLLTPAGFAFGVTVISGRRLLVTDSPRLRAYLTGPGLFEMPAPMPPTQLQAAE